MHPAIFPLFRYPARMATSLPTIMGAVAAASWGAELRVPARTAFRAVILCTVSGPFETSVRAVP